jgi:hypothetical protein
MDTSFMSPEAKAYIDQSVSYALRQASYTQSALRNRAWTTGFATAPTAPTAASSLFVGAAKVTCRGSGIFLASVNYMCTGMTATDTNDTQVSTQTAANLAITNATIAGPGTASASTGTANGAYVSSAAAGILVTGGPLGSLIQYDSGSQVLGTAATTLVFAWSGIIQNSISSTGATTTPFTVGNDVILLCGVNRSAATQVFAGFQISLVELP